jgi:hypothetical protein
MSPASTCALGPGQIRRHQAARPDGIAGARDRSLSGYAAAFPTCPSAPVQRQMIDQSKRWASRLTICGVERALAPLSDCIVAAMWYQALGVTLCCARLYVSRRRLPSPLPSSTPSTLKAMNAPYATLPIDQRVALGRQDAPQAYGAAGALRQQIGLPVTAAVRASHDKRVATSSTCSAAIDSRRRGSTAPHCHQRAPHGWPWTVDRRSRRWRPSSCRRARTHVLDHMFSYVVLASLSSNQAQPHAPMPINLTSPVGRSAKSPVFRRSATTAGA